MFWFIFIYVSFVNLVSLGVRDIFINFEWKVKKVEKKYYKRYGVFNWLKFRLIMFIVLFFYF